MTTPSLEEFLKKHYVDVGFFHSHTSLIQPGGKFQISRTDMEIFWDIYCRKIYNNDSAIVGITEKTQEYMPVVVDVDLKFTESNNDQSLTLADVLINDRLYTDEQVDQIIEIYQSTLRKIVKNCTDKHLMCVVLEKPYYIIECGKSTCVKNGFHLHFPWIILKKTDQSVQLIPRVQSILNQTNLFANIGYKNSGSVIDSNVANVGWLLYGSKKSESMDAYKISRIVNSDLDTLTLYEAFSDYPIYNDDEEEIDIRSNIEFYLPRILSVVPYNREPMEVMSGVKCPRTDTGARTKKSSRKITQNPDIPVQEALEEAGKLLPLLADFRAEDRMEWLTIGWVLYNIGCGTEEALELWLEFSSRCEEKYDESACIYEWDRMTVRDYTLGTLHYYARIDSPEVYKQFKREKTKEYISQAINGSHYDIARILYNEYNTEFICSSYANQTWYRFNNHIWEEIENGVDLCKIISEKIPYQFEEKSSEIMIDLFRSTDKEKTSDLLTKQKSILKIIGNLKSTPFVKNVMTAATALFYDKRFKEKLNQNRYLIAFQNGVYDLKQNIFRDGRPEDSLSIPLPIEYRVYNETDDEVQEVIDFFMKVFPDQELREYFLNIYCEIFVGGNPEKTISFWTGKGDNGKSVTQKLFEKMLGKLAIKFDTTLFTGKKTQTGSANPDLARAGPPVRMATMEETDGDEQMNIGYLKKLTGNDTFWARDLFERGKSVREHEVMFKVTVICNKLPALKYADIATYNRIRVIPYETVFVKHGKPCPEALEEQIRQKRFPEDKHFMDRVERMIPALAWYLLNWRQYHKPACYKEPTKVMEATAMYQRQNDLYREYIDYRIIHERSDNQKLNITELYNDFKYWYRESYPSRTIPNKKEVVQYFSAIWGTPIANIHWKGYRLRTDRDDNETNHNSDISDSEQNTDNSHAPI